MVNNERSIPVMRKNMEDDCVTIFSPTTDEFSILLATVSGKNHFAQTKKKKSLFKITGYERIES